MRLDTADSVGFFFTRQIARKPSNGAGLSRIRRSELSLKYQVKLEPPRRPPFSPHPEPQKRARTRRQAGTLPSPTQPPKAPLRRARTASEAVSQRNPTHPPRPRPAGGGAARREAGVQGENPSLHPMPQRIGGWSASRDAALSGGGPCPRPSGCGPRQPPPPPLTPPLPLPFACRVAVGGVSASPFGVKPGCQPPPPPEPFERSENMACFKPASDQNSV